MFRPFTKCSATLSLLLCVGCGFLPRTTKVGSGDAAILLCRYRSEELKRAARLMGHEAPWFVSYIEIAGNSAGTELLLSVSVSSSDDVRVLLLSRGAARVVTALPDVERVSGPLLGYSGYLYGEPSMAGERQYTLVSEDCPERVLARFPFEPGAIFSRRDEVYVFGEPQRQRGTERARIPLLVFREAAGGLTKVNELEIPCSHTASVEALSPTTDHVLIAVHRDMPWAICRPAHWVLYDMRSGRARKVGLMGLTDCVFLKEDYLRQYLARNRPPSIWRKLLTRVSEARP